ncbi:MAG TPA: class I SAM-dependent methyltransferase [Steroidobacteraceae bacterium]|nr:class I SAM-dependent methyltransferase [Steroidobacteraceae bacterium]
MTEAKDYPLGYSEQEARRLAEQGALLEELTAQMFQRAGLRVGMRVLDIGCGVGDVTLLAARLVGPKGAVLGIDRAASSVETARSRANVLGTGHARFEQAELDSFDTEQTFEVLVGRLVLLYLPDPAATLRRLSRYLRPGGIIAFQEYDISATSQVPAGDLFLEVREWLLSAFAAAGAQLDMGTKLFSTFVRAGLPPPEMTAATPVACGPATGGYAYVAAVLRSLLPLIERAGIATAADIDIETLAVRMREDALAHERVMYLPRVVAAWTALPGARPA